MELRPASRKKAKIKLGLQGCSGSGKTYSALLLAYGLCGQWNKIALIDTENNSADLYDALGDFQVLPLSAPYSPERYIEAIITCEKAAVDVIIIDSISHEWEGIGGVINIHSGMQGNSYLNWNKLTPRHNAFVQKILQSPVHILCTIRSKQDYILIERNGKQVPEKVGMKGITREGMDYEFTSLFELNMQNTATATKDRTNLFFSKPAFVITPETGKIIANWCNKPETLPLEIDNEDIPKRINACKSLGELLSLYNTVAVSTEKFKMQFTKKKEELTLLNKNITHQQNFSTNGSTKN